MTIQRVLLAACCASVSAHVQTPLDCRGWFSREFFRVASAADVAACLDAGADPRAVGASVGATPLHNAAETSADPAVIDVLLAAGADLEAETSGNPHSAGGHTPLHYAAENPEVGVLEVLLAAGADVAAVDWNGNTAIHGVATPAGLDVLLAAGADVNTRNNGGFVSLHYATGDDAMVAALLAAGADVNARSYQDHTPLHHAARDGEDASAIELLLAAGADVDARGRFGGTPLHWAVRDNDSTAVVAALLAAEADVNAQDGDGSTSLQLAVTSNPNPAVFEVLLAGGADMQEGPALLYYAARNPAAFEALLAAGVDLDVNADGRMLLHVAAGGHDTTVLDLLLAAGADVNARDQYGETPLHEAARYSGWREIGRGAVADLGTAVVEALLAAGADVHARSNGGWTPLHAAADSTLNPAVVEVLLSAGADPDARNEGGNAPWEYTFRGLLQPNLRKRILLERAGAEAGAAAASGWLEEARGLRRRRGEDTRWLDEAIQRGRQRHEDEAIERRPTTPRATAGVDLTATRPATGVEAVETFRDCLMCPEMTVIPAGRFRMGCVSGSADCGNDEWPVREVEVASFALGRYEVTFDQYDRFTEATGREPLEDAGWGRGRRPVSDISWEDALAYVDWLSSETDKQYRLPTESEWEYAARAGTTTQYGWGLDVGRNRANCHGCGSRWDDESTAPAGSFDANAWGLHDMHGNVWEWVDDPGVRTDDHGLRMLRGGSWRNHPRDLRAANRSRPRTNMGWNHKLGYGASHNIGFRVARTLP